jgi:hypothetical protein
VTIDYADLIKHYNFSPSEKETFIELLMDKESLVEQASVAFMDSVKKYTPEESNDLAWVNEEIREFFDNDADYDYYTQYADQQVERDKLATLDVGLERIGQPLSDDQREALQAAMYQVRKDANLPEDTLPTKVVTVLQGPIAEKAAAILTPEQMNVLRQDQADDAQKAKLQYAVWLALGGGQ